LNNIIYYFLVTKTGIAEVVIALKGRPGKDHLFF